MKARDRERESRDSVAVMLFILLLGFICIILASGWAIRFAPSWKLPANMGSSLNPNSDFLTNQPLGLLQPLDPAILTNPVWYDVFLTPGSQFSTRTPLPTSTNTLVVLTTPPSQTPQPTLTSTLTATVFIPPPVNTATRTSIPDTRVPNTPTSTSAPPVTSTPTPTPSNTPVQPVDLLITKTDNATHYSAGIAVRYMITVSNPAGPVSATATVIDDFSTNLNLTNVTWVCAGVSGASCTSGGTGSINDAAVVLPAGSYVIYTVDATVVPSPSGDLVNTATVSSANDPNPGNNSATDTDALIVTDPLPPQIGTTPDGTVYNVGVGSLTLNMTTVVNGHPGPDLILYEFLNSGFVYMDWMQIQIGDGANWYTVFNWGDESPDLNSNINYSLPLPDPINPPFPPPQEPDEREIPPNYFYPLIPPPTPSSSSGIAIDLDGYAPPGTYLWLRIISPPGGVDNNMEIDGISVCPSADCP